VATERSRAFAPGRVNLIGEHTDYNGGLALPFAIAQGVTVDAVARTDGRVHARAVDFDEEEAFAVDRLAPSRGWRAFVHGALGELADAGYSLPGAQLRIAGDLPRGAGLSSSAALEVALCLALLALAGEHVEGTRPPGAATSESESARAHLARYDLARLCSRIENEWTGAHTGLLDQLASLFGESGHALLIDFAAEEIEAVPLRLDGWRLAVLDSGERHVLAASGYNRRREECAQACSRLGVTSLREADAAAVRRLPEPLRARAAHVLSENGRVREAVAALRADDLAHVGDLLDASHESLRDLYDVSTPAVERTRALLLEAGARGARLTGGGFGGSVLGLFEPGARPPRAAREVRPGAGARLVCDDPLAGR
jgi:galactokinase